jgi:hypothetical protein
VQIQRIEYAVSGFAHVALQWDRTSDVTIAVLPVGSGIMDFSWFGGFNDPETGDTGDVILTTNDAVPGAAYDLTIYYRAI